MKTRYHIPASLILGSCIALVPVAHAAGTGAGSVELIPFPEGTTDIGNLYFDDDGRVRMLHLYTREDSDIYRYDDGAWTLFRRELRTIVPGITPFGIGDDNGAVVLSDFSRVDIVDGATVYTLPRDWTYTESHNGRPRSVRASGWVSAGTISDDGRVVTLSGRELDASRLDSLIWTGGGELINISDALPREECSYDAGIPNRDGSVIVFEGQTPEGEQIWRWEEGQLTAIPRLDPTLDTTRVLRCVNDAGDAIFGEEWGPDRGGFDFTQPIVAQEDWVRPRSNASIAWVWTPATGTQPLLPADRFDQSWVQDIDADGSVVLGIARAVGQREGRQFLWFGGDDVVMVDDLLHTLNIKIDTDWFSFNAISDDATTLSGLAFANGRYHAIIVTIPAFRP